MSQRAIPVNQRRAYRVYALESTFLVSIVL
jgi:hypothetical protein